MRENLLSRIAIALQKWTERWVPGAFTIACILTFIAFILGVFIGKSSAFNCVKFWGEGFWTLLTFGMQMCLVMFTGYLVACSPPVSRFLDLLARIPRGPKTTIALMATVSMALAWINWGLSIVGSAIFVRFLAKRQRDVDYRLLVATAYLGLGCTWHSGLSASAPLLVATPKHFLEADVGIIPVSETIFHPMNLLMVSVVFLILIFLCSFMHPKKEKTVSVDPKLLEKMERFIPPVYPGVRSFANLLEYTPLINFLMGAMGLIWLVWYFWTKKFTLTLDVVNFAFLTFAVILHKTPASLIKAAEEAGGAIWGIVLQFPLYAGIYGIIKGTNLTEIIGGWFVNFASVKTYPLIIYWYSGIVNYFVPSGGSKWAIEAPYIIEAAKTLGVQLKTVVLSYAWGDMMTDIIQPFWAIPLLGVAKLEFKEILGYCMLIFLVYATLVSLGFAVLRF